MGNLNNSYKKWHRPNTTGTKAEGGTSFTHQGYYNVKNREKYVGDPNLVIYRSSYEFAFMKWCDATQSILQWSSEPMKVPYYDRISKLDECKKLGLDPNNPRNWVTKNYNVDFWVRIKKPDDVIEKWFIEIKPKCKLQKPVPPDKGATTKIIKRFNILAKEYIINEAKFAAISTWAERNNSKFYIFHEEVMMRLGILGGRFEYNKDEKYQRPK